MRGFFAALRMTNIGGVHEALGFDVVARAAALDHVAGEGEGRAAEADDAELVAFCTGRSEVGGDLFDGAGDIQQILGAVGAQRAGLIGGADGGEDAWALVGDELEVEAHGGEGQQEVGEDDGSVNAEALGGGDGDFGGDLRGAADVEQAVVAAYCAVLRHVAAGLAQEPDGSAVDGLAEAGAQESAAITGCRVGARYAQRNLSPNL